MMFLLRLLLPPSVLIAISALSARYVLGRELKLTEIAVVCVLAVAASVAIQRLRARKKRMQLEELRDSALW
jgi:hypothetical protein